MLSYFYCFWGVFWKILDFGEKKICNIIYQTWEAGRGWFENFPKNNRFWTRKLPKVEDQERNYVSPPQSSVKAAASGLKTSICKDIIKILDKDKECWMILKPPQYQLRDCQWNVFCGGTFQSLHQLSIKLMPQVICRWYVDICSSKCKELTQLTTSSTIQNWFFKSSSRWSESSIHRANRSRTDPICFWAKPPNSWLQAGS